MPRKFLFVLTFCFFTGFVFGAAGDYDLSVFFTSNLMGRMQPFTVDENPNQGGLPAIATIIQQRRTDKPNRVIVVDTGNQLGSSSDTILLEGKVESTAMNAVGYNVAGTGYTDIQISLELFGKYNNTVEHYMLSANIIDKTEEMPIADLSNVYTAGGWNGIKIGFFSLISEEATQMISARTRSQVEITDPLEAAKVAVEQLKSKGAVVIIALTNIGVTRTNGLNAMQLAQEIPEINIIIDGYDNVKSDTPIMSGDTRIIQSASYGLYLGEIGLMISQNQITGFELTQHPINYYRENAEPIAQNVTVASSITQAINRRSMVTRRFVGWLRKGQLSNEGIRDGETPLGNLICDAMVDLTGADVAFQNAGGIGVGNFRSAAILRDSLNDLIKYDNTMYILEMTGSQLIDTLKFSMKRIGYGPFLQVGGIRFKYSRSTEEIAELTVAGQPVDTNAIYKVAVNSWLKQGGDGYGFLQNLTANELSLHHREAVYNYIQIKGGISAEIDGRITITE